MGGKEGDGEEGDGGKEGDGGRRVMGEEGDGVMRRVMGGGVKTVHFYLLHFDFALLS